MNELPYFTNLDRIKERYESKDLYAYTIREGKFVSVPGGFLGRFVTWIGNALGIRTNEQLVAQLALSQLKFVDNLLQNEITLNAGSLDPVLLSKIKSATASQFFKGIDKLSPLIEKMNKDIENNEFHDTEQEFEDKMGNPEPSDLPPEQTTSQPDSVEDSNHDEFSDSLEGFEDETGNSEPSNTPPEQTTSQPESTDSEGEFVDAEDDGTLHPGTIRYPLRSQAAPVQDTSSNVSDSEEQSDTFSSHSSDLSILSGSYSGDEAIARLALLLLTIYDDGEIVDSIQKILPKKLSTYEYNPESEVLTLTYPSVISGKMGKITVEGWTRLSEGELKISPKLKLKIDFPTKTLTVIEGSMTGYAKQYTFLGRKLPRLHTSIKSVAVTPERNFLVTPTLLPKISQTEMTFDEFNTIFQNLSFE